MSSQSSPASKAKSNGNGLRKRQGKAAESGDHDHHHHEHQHEHDHSHSHSKSIFHTHSHGEDGHSHSPDAEKIFAALKGAGDRGSQITLVGLFSNVGLTAAKGLAGWYLHSASLLADAGHSMSDLLGDFVTLFCWKLSRKPPSEQYPYGFAKFETLGTTTISILLIGGALGIGFHSWKLLVVALGDTASHMSPSTLQDVLMYISSNAPVPHLGHAHAHAHSVDPNAAWFAAIGVVAKEWLYRITKVVADEERSPVLLANAIHHRSDAYSSLVAFFAILGTWVFPALPLDPIGGLVVSMVIFQQGLSLFKGAWGDLTDAGVSKKMLASISQTLQPLCSEDGFDISQVRARRSGSLVFVDLVAIVPGDLSVVQTTALDQKIQKILKESKKEVAEVTVRFEPQHHL